MSRYVETYEGILGNFNKIGNEKAAAILWMFREAFTSETFTKGVKYYLNAMKFGAATPDDLHRELQRALDEDQPGNGVDVGEMMRTWEDQSGYPVITVHKSKNKFVLTQKRVRSGPDIFAIPLAIVAKHNQNSTIPITFMKSQEMEIEAQIGDDWLILDPNSFGYFEVEYSQELIEALVLQLVNNERLIPSSFKPKILEKFCENFNDISKETVEKTLRFVASSDDSELKVFADEILKLLEAKNLNNEIQRRRFKKPFF
jgi:aminopeptidase N